MIISLRTSTVRHKYSSRHRRAVLPVHLQTAHHAKWDPGHTALADAETTRSGQASSQAGLLPCCWGQGGGSCWLWLEPMQSPWQAQCGVQQELSYIVNY